MTNNSFGTFNDLLGLAQSVHHSTMNRLKELILDIHSESCEVVRLGDRAATFGVGPKKMSEGYVYIMPHKKWVNLGFYKGALLEDPSGMLEGKGKSLRHIKIHQVEQVDQPEIKLLID
ncbi:MAG: DUF1801 domain-containing protein [Bacteroidota bacterium]